MAHARKPIPRIRSYSPSKLKAVVIGWNVPTQTVVPFEFVIPKSEEEVSRGWIGKVTPPNLREMFKS